MQTESTSKATRRLLKAAKEKRIYKTLGLTYRRADKMSRLMQQLESRRMQLQRNCKARRHGQDYKDTKELERINKRIGGLKRYEKQRT